MKNRTQPSLVTQLPPHTKTTNLYTRRIQHISHHTPHTAHHAPHTAHHTPHTTHHTPRTAHRTAHTAHYTPHTAHHTPHTTFQALPTLCSLLSMPHSSLLIHHSTLRTLHSQLPTHKSPLSIPHALLTSNSPITLSTFHSPLPNSLFVSFSLPIPNSHSPFKSAQLLRKRKFKFMQQKGSERRKKMSKRSETIGAKET